MLEKILTFLNISAIRAIVHTLVVVLDFTVIEMLLKIKNPNTSMGRTICCIAIILFIVVIYFGFAYLGVI